MDTTGDQGTWQARVEYTRRFRDNYNIKVIQKSERSQVVMAFNIGICMSVQAVRKGGESLKRWLNQLLSLEMTYLFIQYTRYLMEYQLYFF
jgi:hypothetical protein